jgi:hypothetical protein
VWSTGYCAHHGQALSRDMDTTVFEDFLRGHSLQTKTNSGLCPKLCFH